MRGNFVSSLVRGGWRESVVPPQSAVSGDDGAAAVGTASAITPKVKFEILDGNGFDAENFRQRGGGDEHGVLKPRVVVCHLSGRCEFGGWALQRSRVVGQVVQTDLKHRESAVSKHPSGPAYRHYSSLV